MVAKKKVAKVVKKKVAAPAEKKVVAEKKVAAAPKKVAKKTEKVEEVTVVEKAAEPRMVEKKMDKSGKAPSTMDELLKQVGYTLSAPKPGEVLKGLVTDVTKRMVMIDIGAKTEGMVVDREFESARDLIGSLHVGDEVTVYVVTPENERGQILLSMKRAQMDRKWEQFAEYMETNESVEVTGVEVNKGGMIVQAETVRGFVPSSQFGKDFLGNMEALIGQKFKVKVIEVDREKNRLIFSERHVSEAQALAKKAEALQFVKVGDTYDGVVSGIMPFGVFVGVEVPVAKGKDATKGKLEGLVHISEISWEKVQDPNDYFKLGDKVSVRVLGVDEAAGKLNLSVKQLKDDPWSLVEQKYPVGAKAKGKVTRLAAFGAFVTLEAGVDGLIHISKIPAGEEPKVGQEVEVYVETVDLDHRRMSLGMVLTEVPMGYK